MAGEALTAITYGIDGLARGTRLTLPPEVFSGSNRTGAITGLNSAIFGSDGKFLGYCRVDACGTASSCDSMRSILDRSNFLPQYFGSAGIRWGTLNNDLKWDAVAVHLGNVFVRLSSESSLTRAARWLATPSAGILRTVVGDLDGDRLSDLVMVDQDAISARRSTSSAFDESKTWLRRSTGSALLDEEVWATAPSGFERVWFSDVTGNGTADAVFAVDGTLVVYPSSGTAFDAPEVWLDDANPGAPGWFFGDVTGDGRSDAVSIDTTGVHLFSSTGGRFVLAAPLRVEPTIGERDNALVDVNGDGRADVIAHNHINIVSYLSTGTDFQGSTAWHMEPFYGGIYADE